MKSIINLLIITILFSCGKDSEPLQRKQLIPMEGNSLTSFPYLHLSKIEKVVMTLENSDKKEEFVSNSTHIGKKDFLRKKILLNLHLDSKDDRENISIDHQDFLMYQSDLFSTKEYLENIMMLKKNTDQDFEKGKITLRANFEFRNLNRITSMEDLFLGIYLIDTQDLKKKFIKDVRLFKYGQDPDVINTHGRTSANPRQAHTIRIEELAPNILRKLITGKAKLGFMLSAGKINFYSSQGSLDFTASYKKIVSQFFNSRNFIYIKDDKKLLQIVKKENEELESVLKRLDPAIEISQDGKIQYLFGLDSSLPHYSTSSQVQNSHENEGLWRKHFLNGKKTILLDYLRGRDIKSVRVHQEPLNIELPDFERSYLPSLMREKMNRRVFIFSKGFHQKPEYLVQSKRSVSRVDEPRICHRHFEHLLPKAECLGKDLSCYYSLRTQAGYTLLPFTKKDYGKFLNIQKGQGLIEIEKQWYSEKLKGHFILGRVRNFEGDVFLSGNIQKSYGRIQLGVINFGHCPSRTERGFSLPGVRYPAVDIESISRPMVNLQFFSNALINPL